MMATEQPLEVVIRRANPDDLEGITTCIEPFVEQGKLLARTSDELETFLPNCFVAEVGGEIVGCAALEIYSPKLAEVRSLVVVPKMQGRGIGRSLVEACIERARSKHVLEVMAITSSEHFFKACGFDFTLPGEKKALFLQTRDL